MTILRKIVGGASVSKGPLFNEKDFTSNTVCECGTTMDYLNPSLFIAGNPTTREVACPQCKTSSYEELKMVPQTT